jgi:putative nucleotidyltransferase with HDIG domain
MAPSYDDSLALFHTWTETESLRRHAYAVESSMAYYAERFDADVEKWRITGLLHDMDYEKHPSQEEHPFVGVKLLTELGYPDDVTEAILGHATYSGVPRVSMLAKALFAVDELAGFITAVGHVRPNGLDDLKVSSIRKKLKDKRFAAAVNRQDIADGAAELEVELGEHIANVAAGMSRESARLGF